MDDLTRSAGQSGIRSLYHYQDFELKPDLILIDRLIDILVNHRVYCSRPTDFNDPWDCKPCFDPNLLDNPLNQAATAEALIATRLDSPTAAREDHFLRTDLPFLKGVMQQFYEEQMVFIPTRWGVYCLSPDPCITLMWSHYSRNHKGICLEFGVENSKFVGAVSVRYQEEYPELLLYEAASYLQMLLIKSDVWDYEQEFRLICPHFTDVEGTPLKLDGNHLSIGAHDLKSIILGCQMDAETAETIKTLVREYAPSVVVKRAARVPNHYKLTIVDY